MRFDVPYIPEEGYTAFINANARHISAVHYSLQDPAVPDARCRVASFYADQLADGLRALKIQHKYLLLNSRFHHPRFYADPRSLRELIVKIENLLSHGIIDGIVYTDAYFLESFSQASPDVASRLEAVPSVNCMIDSVDKLRATISLIDSTQFRAPGKIILDRGLNRRLDDLSQVADVCRHINPDMRTTLLVNEGCIYQCPFKPAHDAHIALANMGVPVDTFTINQTRGCMRALLAAPHNVLQSPFIRPEDVAFYENSADVLKICGRTLGAPFLRKTVSAYINGSYDGNLLDLMDALDWMAALYYIDNKRLPPDFLKTVTTCGKSCTNCNICLALFKTAAQRKPFEFKALP